MQFLSIFWNSVFGSSYDTGLTLFYSTSYIFTGLAVAMAAQAGLFNIGAEGQLTMAVLAAAVVGTFFKTIPAPLAPLLALVAALSMAALWSFIPGYLKAKRNTHEVIVTMMMNFIAAGISSYVVLNFIKNPDTQNPESAPVAAQYLLKSSVAAGDTVGYLAGIFQDSPANLAFFVALLVAVLMQWFLDKTTWGYELKAVGSNEEASSLAGISTARMKILAMVLSGTLAGFVALNEVMGSAGRFRIGFSVDYGFVGIAVALLARNRPLAIIFSGLFFGFLQKGAADLDIETDFITRDFAKVLQAFTIFIVAGLYHFNTKGLLNTKNMMAFYQRTKKNWGF